MRISSESRSATFVGNNRSLPKTRPTPLLAKAKPRHQASESRDDLWLLLHRSERLELAVNQSCIEPLLLPHQDALQVHPVLRPPGKNLLHYQVLRAARS